jgi:hypothetical protein
MLPTAPPLPDFVGKDVFLKVIPRRIYNKNDPE